MNRKRLTLAIRKSLLFEEFPHEAEVSLFLTDDDNIREMNQEYRGIDRSTDVLSFAQLEGESAPAAGEIIVLGDIVISVEKAKRQAAEATRTLEDEMDALVVHGILHLLGNNHEKPDDAGVMKKKEKEIERQLKNGRKEF